ncbi:MAG: bifunctional adenosylcobinamide kinase/adenosylcobinamide-phosphate guanylyltransferase [Lachnospiraceae bacterium]|nr:bifunctional adenosylcobinamide kinase/adenosylcobinamide-phosphate guanylyltransferase [Lachnospiraceae bacterium]
MKLIVGGYAQGKLNYVLNRYVTEDYVVLDGGLTVNAQDHGKIIIINHFHRWVKESIRHGGCPETEVKALLAEFPDCIIVSDEIGNGIVPIDKMERDYRERTGRLLVELAGQADEVVRVICGIGQKIK